MDTTEVIIRRLASQELDQMVSSFREMGSDRSRSRFDEYLAEQQEGVRTVLVAYAGDSFAGYLTIQWESDYSPFQEERIPEIKDFNVIERFRRRRIGTALMDKAESLIASQSHRVGIGVGLTPDYGAAQRLYVLRGYVPDGRGMFQSNVYPKYGDEVRVDDDLVIFFTKELARPSE